MDLKTKIDTIRGWLTNDGDGARLWDILTGLRGPDSPSERPNMATSESSVAYKARRARKRETVEVIRGHSFPGCGVARWRKDIDYVTLPPAAEWDHFDKHVARSAEALGLKVVFKGTEPAKEAPIKAKVKKADAGVDAPIEIVSKIVSKPLASPNAGKVMIFGSGSKELSSLSSEDIPIGSIFISFSIVNGYYRWNAPFAWERISPAEAYVRVQNILAAGGKMDAVSWTDLAKLKKSAHATYYSVDKFDPLDDDEE